MAEMNTDVVVVGGGNAALCAALAAREQGAEVTVLERAPVEERGGNSRFTAGMMRVVYNGLDDVLKLVPDLSDDEKINTDFGTYTRDDFYDDMARVTQYRADPDMVEILVERSFETLLWMRSKGLRFLPSYGRQAFKIGNKFKFWGGLTFEANGGGPGLVEGLFGLAEKNGIGVQYRTRAVNLLADERGAEWCTKVVWLESGRIVMVGEPTTVLERYAGQTA